MTLDEAVNRLCDSLDKFSAALTVAAQVKTSPATAPAAEAPLAEQARKPPVRAAAPRTPAAPKTAEKPSDNQAAPPAPAEGEGIAYETLRGAVLKLAAAQGTKAAIAAIQSIGGPKIKSATELPREQWQEAYDHIQGLLAPGVA
jgi:hypothetical protein